MPATNKFIIPVLSLMAFNAYASDISYTVDLYNPLGIDRTDCPIEIDLLDIAPDMTVNKAIVNDGSAEIACQIDDLDADGRADKLAFVIDMGANEQKNLQLTLSDTGVQPEYAPRVWAGFMLRGPKKDQYPDIISVTVPGNVNFYNMVYGHGPMFESELVGYRVYFNQKQTLDPYGKFQKRLELKQTNFYPTDQHIAEGYGDDVLLAGNSCGIGAFKGWDGTEATHVEPVASRTERVIAYGPVRTIVEVLSDDWQYQGDKIDMLNRYTLYAGHRDLKVDVVFDKPLKDQTFATGVERIMGNETVSMHDGQGLVGSWGRHYPVTDTIKYAKETIGIATYVPRKYVKDYVEDPSNFLYTLAAPGETSLTYYTMFTSKKETFGFEDSDDWFAYLPKWRESLESPIVVTVKNN